MPGIIILSIKEKLPTTKFGTACFRQGRFLSRYRMPPLYRAKMQFHISAKKARTVETIRAFIKNLIRRAENVVTRQRNSNLSLQPKIKKPRQLPLLGV